jgi:ribosome-associated heat shock protein Hsp15
MADETIVAQRIDRWLWHARFVRSRNDAQDLVRRGRVRRNRQPLDTPSSLVRVGDVLTVTLLARVVVVEVIGFAERRGPASAVAGLARIIPPEGPDHAA